jgi:hypothetical protein
MHDDQMMKAMFGRRRGGIKQRQVELAYNVDAINAYQHGLSVPIVAFDYRYESFHATPASAFYARKGTHG